MKKTALLLFTVIALMSRSQSQLTTEFCNDTAHSVAHVIYADAVTGATDYRFLIENAGLSYSQTYTNTFYPATAFYAVPGLTLATTYTVSVATSNNNQTSWSSYGSPCTIVAPGDYTTTIIPAHRNLTPAWNQYLECYDSRAAVGDTYKFRLMNTALSYDVAVISSNEVTNLLAFHNTTALLPNTTYTIDIQMYYNGSFQNWGPPCNVTTPSATVAIESTYCNQTMVGWNNQISCYPLSGTTNYKFQVRDQANTFTVTAVSGNQNTAFSNFTGLLGSHVYSVSVSLEFGGSYQPYGPECVITTPSASTSIEPSYCGQTYDWNNSIACYAVPGVTNYKFRLDNVGLSYQSDVISGDEIAALSQFSPQPALNTTYQLSVATEFNSVYGPFSPVACPVTTPGSYRMAMPTGINEYKAVQTDITPTLTDIYGRPYVGIPGLYFEKRGDKVKLINKE